MLIYSEVDIFFLGYFHWPLGEREKENGNALVKKEKFIGEGKPQYLGES